MKYLIKLDFPTDVGDALWVEKRNMPRMWQELH